MAGEYIFSPAVTGRAGFGFFYGWVTPKIKTAANWSGVVLPSFATESSGHGYHWGIGASLGGTIHLKSITLEPFVGGGYDPIHLTLHGGYPVIYWGGLPPIDPPMEEKLTRNQWFVTTGLSILFNL
jgi:hypothetical protein